MHFRIQSLILLSQHSHSTMRWTLHLFVCVLLLFTFVESFEKRIHRKTMFRQPPSQGAISHHAHQPVNVQSELVNNSISLTPGNLTGSHLASRRKTTQGDQLQRAGPNRRVMSNRRVPQLRTPVNRGSASQDGGTKPQPRRALPSPARIPSGAANSINILAGFAGRNRVLVISAPHEADGYYRLMMSLMKPDVYCEMAERHMHQIVMFHQDGEAGGKVRRVSTKGQITEEPLDPALVPRLMGFLKLEEGKFSMVLLRKNLQVEEVYPYPVRLEAMYEVMDLTPIRRQEKARQRGFVQRCKAAGVEGEVLKSPGTQKTLSSGQHNASLEIINVNTAESPAQVPTSANEAVSTSTTRRTTAAPMRTTTTTTTTTTTHPTTQHTPPTTVIMTTTTAKPTTVTFKATTATVAGSTTAVGFASTDSTTFDQETGLWRPDSIQIQEDYTHLTITGEPGTNEKPRKVVSEPSQEVATSSTELTDSNSEGKVGGNEKSERGSVPRKKDEIVNDNQGRGEKIDKSSGKNKPDKRRTKTAKEGHPNLRGRKSGKKGALYQEKHGGDGPSAKQPKVLALLASFFASFERRRRLLVITTPSEENRMYTQQRDEYLENVCEMAVRKLSIITIFGSLANGTMKIDHFKLEQDQPLSGLPEEYLTNQALIRALRKDLGMTFDDYYMVLTDLDVKAKQEYEVPIAMKAVFDYIDTFSSRIAEMEQQKKLGVMCAKEEKSRSLENFLSRFRWRRRLFIISAPDDEEWAYQQQLYSLNSQACNLGLRHMSVLKLIGKDTELMGGVLELYPINGSSTVEREELSAALVQDIRNYFQVSPEYFSMLLVGKDGNVKSWYPSPMWSMSIIYDLVDSMQLRRQEMAIQQSLGMRCRDDDDYAHHGHHERDQDGYSHRGYGY